MKDLKDLLQFVVELKMSKFVRILIILFFLALIKNPALLGL